MAVNVHIVLRDGIIESVLATDPDISVEIVELNSDYIDSDDADQVYAELKADKTLGNCNYTHRLIKKLN